MKNPGLLFVLYWLAYAASYVVCVGITQQATPSVVILGTAKGGTTDIWNLLHILHAGFASFATKDLKGEPLENGRSQIRPWKELLFFNERYDYCKSGNNKRYCDVSEMSTLLHCPSQVFFSGNTPHSKIIQKCKDDIRVRNISIPLFTATASPMLFQSAQAASPPLMHLYHETKSPPFFAVLMRNPTKATISLYNHGMVR